jgi:2-C-methyl-D-erythritol 4-phosphate cytidylyltransferase
MNIAIIPAAGSGTRLGGSIPKQFLPLAGIPIIFHALLRFETCPQIDAIAISLPENELVKFDKELAKRDFQKPLHLVPGGKERSDSILNALEAVAGLSPEIVVVHDAVRPFVSMKQITAVIARAAEVGAAILALPVTDTIKEVEHGMITRTLDRRKIYRAQTPQAFRYELLRQANEAARRDSVPSDLMTDDSLLVERLGAPIAVVEGSPDNLKITTPEDLLLAEKMMSLELRVEN